jgi:nitrite reductase/ring-hydroxylating ferredoxin subunit
MMPKVAFRYWDSELSATISNRLQECRLENCEDDALLLSLDKIQDRESQSFTLAGKPSGGFMVNRDGEYFAYVNSCPHTGAPLEWTPDQFLDAEGGHIICAVHGALFEIATGLCVYGPCTGASLESVPLEVMGSKAKIKTT